jgi:hypothetical protein
LVKPWNIELEDTAENTEFAAELSASNSDPHIAYFPSLKLSCGQFKHKFDNNSSICLGFICGVDLEDFRSLIRNFFINNQKNYIENIPCLKSFPYF